MGFGINCEFIVIVVSILLIHALRVRIPAMFVIPFVFVSMKVQKFGVHFDTILVFLKFYIADWLQS